MQMRFFIRRKSFKLGSGLAARGSSYFQRKELRTLLKCSHCGGNQHNKDEYLSSLTIPNSGKRKRKIGGTPPKIDRHHRNSDKSGHNRCYDNNVKVNIGIHGASLVTSPPLESPTSLPAIMVTIYFGEEKSRS